jgi:uncharacterized membrane protein
LGEFEMILFVVGLLLHTYLLVVCLLNSAVLSSVFLGESLGLEGKIGCALSIIGSVIIVLHAPDEKDPKDVDEILGHAAHPIFILYVIAVIGITLYLIYRMAPKYGKTNMLIYIGICSLVGSISVMACKAFGIALKLTFAGNNQFSRFSTYVFLITVGVSVVVQMNYFNKALDTFSTNRVTPIYYVFFTTATIFASAVLFQSFYNIDAKDIVSVFSGFMTIFVGVFLLNTKKNPHTHSSTTGMIHHSTHHNINMHDPDMPLMKSGPIPGHRNSFSLAVGSIGSNPDGNTNATSSSFIPGTAAIQRGRSHMSISESHLLKTFAVEGTEDDGVTDEDDSDF